MGRKIVAVVAGVASAFLLYATYIVISVAASVYNGEGIGCRDAECGAVASFEDATSPWLPIAVALLSVAIGFRVGRALWPTRTNPAPGTPLPE